MISRKYNTDWEGEYIYVDVIREIILGDSLRLHSIIHTNTNKWNTIYIREARIDVYTTHFALVSLFAHESLCDQNENQFISTYYIIEVKDARIMERLQWKYYLHCLLM